MCRIKSASWFIRYTAAIAERRTNIKTSSKKIEACCVKVAGLFNRGSSDEKASISSAECAKLKEVNGMIRMLVTIMVFIIAWSQHAQSQKPLFIPAPGSPVVVGAGSGRLVFADVNGDGRLDLVTTHLLQKSVTVH